MLLHLGIFTTRTGVHASDFKVVTTCPSFSPRHGNWGLVISAHIGSSYFFPPFNSYNGFIPDSLNLILYGNVPLLHVMLPGSPRPNAYPANTRCLDQLMSDFEFPALSQTFLLFPIMTFSILFAQSSGLQTLLFPQACLHSPFI